MLIVYHQVCVQRGEVCPPLEFKNTKCLYGENQCTITSLKSFATPLEIPGDAIEHMHQYPTQ